MLASAPAADPTSDAFNNDCPGRTVISHIASRWGILVLAALRDGPLRFSAIRDRIDGISEKMLAQNLRLMVRDGLVDRAVEPTAPPQVSYALTPLGDELTVPLQGMLDWVALRAHDIVAAQDRYDRSHPAG
ncbi:transcriptional regulator, HxlR family [Actinoalloteichus hymeniacidonis]|uniref:Transcriptional regulator, HxlR family n=2 Tax=Actinoalloteichus hymeniacidonis TaxID=340345 RepID=A0AAC9MYS3_9PSEU|nr:transcriptional regulator, HxlR family [Actinoalloteichus hymeniacidonis]